MWIVVLCAGYVYTLRVQLTSWLNASDVQLVPVSTVAAALPAVSVQSGLVVTPVSAFTVIDGVVSVPAGCASSNATHNSIVANSFAATSYFFANSSSYEIQWAQMTAANASQFIGAQGAAGLASDPLNLTAPAGSLRLVLAPFSLQLNRTYGLLLSVRTAGGVAWAAVLVQAYASPLVALVLGGNVTVCPPTLSSGSSSSFVTLDGSGSYDPTALASSEGLNFSWTCSRRVTRSPCFAGSALSNAAQLAVPYSRLVQALLIEDSSAGPFDFTLRVAKGARTASATVFVVVSTAACVSVSLQPFLHPPDVRRAINILATVQLDDGDALSLVTWDAVWTNGLGQGSVPSSSLQVASNTSTTLVVAGDSLQPGVPYTFTVRVATALGGSGAASLQLTPKQGPQGGVCSVDPPQGNASTVFSVRCTGVSDAAASLPLSFGFYMLGNDGTQLPLCEFSSSAALTTTLPVPVVGGDTVGVTRQVLVVARNMLGLSSALYATVVLFSLAPSSTAASAAVGALVSSQSSSTASPLDYLRSAVTAADLLAGAGGGLAHSSASASQLLSSMLQFRGNASALGWNPTPALFTLQARVASALAGGSTSASASLNSSYFALVQGCLGDLLVSAKNARLGVPSVGSSSGTSSAIDAFDPVIGLSVGALAATAAAASTGSSESFSDGVMQSWRAVSAAQATSLAPGAPSRTDQSRGLSLVAQVVATVDALSAASFVLNSPNQSSAAASVSFSGPSLARSVFANSTSVSFAFTHSTANVFAAWQSSVLAGQQQQQALRSAFGDVVGLSVSVDGALLPTVVTTSDAPFTVQLAVPELAALTWTEATTVTAQCVWWNESHAAWSADGCELVSVAGGSAVCRCVHLTFFAIRVAEYPSSVVASGAADCAGFACAPVAREFRWLQWALLAFALAQLGLGLYQLAVQCLIVRSKTVFSQKRTVGLLQTRLLPWTLLNAAVFFLQQLDPYGVDGVWPKLAREAVHLLLALTALLVSLVTSAVACCIILQLAFSARLHPFPIAIPRVVYGLVAFVVTVSYVGAGCYLGLGDIGSFYIGVLALYLTGVVLILIVFDVYAVILLVYNHRVRKPYRTVGKPKVRSRPVFV